MKTSSLFLAPVLGLSLMLSAARAEEPAATSNLQEVQGIIDQLSKLAGLAPKTEGAPDFGKVLTELAKLATVATPATTKEGQAQETQLISFVKSLLTMIPQVPAEAAETGADDTAVTTVNTTSKQQGGAAGIQGSTGLSTGSLSTGSLGGTQAPKMTEAEWRALFPQPKGGR